LAGALGALRGGELPVVLEEVEQLEPQGVGHGPDAFRVVDDELLVLGHDPTLSLLAQDLLTVGRRRRGPVAEPGHRWSHGGVRTKHGGVMWTDGGPPSTAAPVRRGPGWTTLAVAVLLALVVGALATLGITATDDDAAAPSPAATAPPTAQ